MFDSIILLVSENPQTFNQALLLVATLARLTPETVLRNVMPVFTFMGSNVFHRDDTYSFRVVQKVCHVPARTAIILSAEYTTDHQRNSSRNG